MEEIQLTTRIGLVASAFDLLHAGHVLLLQDARQQCDHLIAALHTDPTIERPHTKFKPTQSTLERFIQLHGCRYVDQIIPYDTEEDLRNIMLIYNVTDLFLGSEYAKTQYTGHDLKLNAHFHPRTHTYSSTALRKKIKGG